ncbi:MAG: ribosomal large subunit pseudouridine synthase [Deltaproteobacteria bacterium]|nr:ribosomal large subunit pseudouridine synthase [Deltaproteobacteria bacterium]
METVRLSKFLAQCGVASRRKADELIKSGSVYVNNIRIVDAYHQVNPHKDVVICQNVTLSLPRNFLYLALHKPPGYMSDLKDARGRPLAVSLIDSETRLFPVGRLDFQSEGLMLFTSDGAFANKIMHPRYSVEKEYLVKVKGKLSAAELAHALKGVTVDAEHYSVDTIELAKTEAANCWYRVTVHEGKKHLVRKLAEGLGHPVLRLIRVRIGIVRIGTLKRGAHRRLTRSEVEYFLRPQRPST